jgi:hypothetical protein
LPYFEVEVFMPEQFDDPQKLPDDHQNEPPSYTPYLYIRYNNGDTGNRPLTPGTNFWSSPDILVTPTDTFGNVQVGTDVTVQTRIWNGGLAPAYGVYVEFYWANPSLGIALNPSQRIGTKLVTAPAQNYVDVVCPVTWKPAFVNGGHECLIVRCTYAPDPDSNRSPFSAEFSRFVGQRNITVVGQAGRQMLSLLANNPFQTSQVFTLRLSSLMVRGNFDQWRERNDGELINLLANIQTGSKPQTEEEKQLEWDVLNVTEKDLDIRVTRIAPAEIKDQENTEQEIARYLHERTLRNPDFETESLGKILGEFVLEPRMANVVEIDIPPTVLGIGQFIIHRFTQVVSGCDIGGYTVIVPPLVF